MIDVYNPSSVDQLIDFFKVFVVNSCHVNFERILKCMHIKLVPDSSKLQVTMPSGSKILFASLELNNIGSFDVIKLKNSSLWLEEPCSNNRDKIVIDKEVIREYNPYVAPPLHRDGRQEVNLLNGILPTVRVVNEVEVIFVENSILVYSGNSNIKESP